MSKIKADKRNISISKEAFIKTKEKFYELLPGLSAFSVMVIFSLLLAFYIPSTLIFTVPFVITPGFFALTANNVILERDNKKPLSLYFFMYRVYFTSVFFGGFRIISGLLKSLLATFITSFVLIIILYLFILNKDPSSIAFFESFYQNDSYLYTYDFVSLIGDNQIILITYYISTLFSIFAGIYTFIHHIGIETIKFQHNLLAVMPVPMSQLNKIYASVYVRTKKELNTDYCSALGLITITLITILAVFTSLGFFLLSKYSIDQIMIIGLFISFIILILSLPYILNVFEVIYLKYRDKYVDMLVKNSAESLKRLKEDAHFDEKSEEELRKIIDMQKKSFNDSDIKEKIRSNNQDDND